MAATINEDLFSTVMLADGSLLLPDNAHVAPRSRRRYHRYNFGPLCILPKSPASRLGATKAPREEGPLRIGCGYLVRGALAGAGASAWSLAG